MCQLDSAGRTLHNASTCHSIATLIIVSLMRCATQVAKEKVHVVKNWFYGTQCIGYTYYSLHTKLVIFGQTYALSSTSGVISISTLSRLAMTVSDSASRAPRHLGPPAPACKPPGRQRAGGAIIRECCPAQGSARASEYGNRRRRCPDRAPMLETAAASSRCHQPQTRQARA
jgi:hypothetical protein